jgi:vitamin B12 transporter
MILKIDQLWTVSFVSFCFLVLSAIHAIAQDEPPILEEVVSTATRTEVPVGELGVSVTVITADEIESRKTTDVLNLLRDVEGLNVVQSGSRGGNTSLFPRGGEENYTLVLIDGVQVNQAGGGFDFSSITTDNIERIEVIRGPQSALYGSDAIGGVIQIFTKKGMGKPTVRVSTADGAHSENGHFIGEQKVSVSGGSELIGYSFAYGRIDDQGILDVNNDYDNNTFSGRVDLYPLETCDIAVTARIDKSKFEFPTENGGDRVDRIFPGLDPEQDQERTEVVASAQTRFDLFPWWEHAFHLGIHRLDQDFEDPPNPLETAFDAPPSSQTDSLETRFMFDYHTNFHFPQEGMVRSILTVGYEFDREDVDQDSTVTLRFGPLPFGALSVTDDTDVDRNNHAFYLQEQITLFDRLYLTGGFRVEDNDEYGTDVNPRGSAAFQIKETGTKLRFAMGTGIKEPTFVENFGGFGTIGNPDLDAEESFSWEVGVDQSLWGDRVQLGVTYFENDYDDMIAFLQTPFPPPDPLPPNYFNIQQAESWGVEFSTRVDLGYGLTLGGNYTYLHTEVTDDGGLGNLFFAEGEELLRRPNHSGSFFVDWLWRNLNVRVNGTYVGERDDTLFLVEPGPFLYTFTNERVENDDYFVLDLAASYTIEDLGRSPLQSLKFFVKARNIANEDYEEVFGFSSPRASAMGGIEFTF